jgi:hypothetical protein
MSCKRCRCECNERIQPTSDDFRATQHDHDFCAEDKRVDGAIFLRPCLELEMGVFHRHLRASLISINLQSFRMRTDLVQIPDDGQGRRPWWVRFWPPSYQQQTSEGQEPDREGEKSSL